MTDLDINLDSNFNLFSDTVKILTNKDFDNNLTLELWKIYSEETPDANNTNFMLNVLICLTDIFINEKRKKKLKEYLKNVVHFYIKLFR